MFLWIIFDNKWQVSHRKTYYYLTYINIYIRKGIFWCFFYLFIKKIFHEILHYRNELFCLNKNLPRGSQNSIVFSTFFVSCWENTDFRYRLLISFLWEIRPSDYDLSIILGKTLVLTRDRHQVPRIWNFTIIMLYYMLQNV